LYLWCVINFLDQFEVPTDHVSSQPVGYLCRILYRSRQRGYLELDLLLGKWAENNAAHLNEKRLQDLVDLLEQVACCDFAFSYCNLIELTERVIFVKLVEIDGY
jgi:hypothetical protein